MSTPSVTAVMITGHDVQRRLLARWTIQSFPKQTYDNATLLVLNQGSTPLLTETIPRVREVMAGQGLVVGDFRNLAWRYAESDLMTCWDDDDVHHPERLATQVSRFSGPPLAFRSEIYLHLGTGESMVFSRQRGFENTLLWKRQCKSRYSSQPRGSDSHFLRQLGKEYGRLRIVDNSPLLYVRLFHGRNIWPETHFFQDPRQQASHSGNTITEVRELNSEETHSVASILSIYRPLVVPDSGT